MINPGGKFRFVGKDEVHVVFSVMPLDNGKLWIATEEGNDWIVEEGEIVSA